METLQMESVKGTCFMPSSHADAILSLHELSMSKKPNEACTGRAGKHLINALDCWLGDEKERRTEGDLVLAAALSMAVSIVLSAQATVVRPEFYESMAAQTLLVFMKAFTEGTAQQVAEHRKLKEQSK